MCFVMAPSGPKGSLKGVSTVEIGREEWYLMSIEGGIMEESEILENSTSSPEGLPMSCSGSNLTNVVSLEQMQEFITDLWK